MNCPRHIGFKFKDVESNSLFISEIDAYSFSDINRDGNFDICDLVYICKNLDSSDTYADYNQSGAVNATDISECIIELLNK